MDFAKDRLAALRAGPVPPSVWVLVLALVFSALAIILGRRLRGVRDEPPSVPRWKGIPLLGNTIEYIVDNASFISRARLAMQTRTKDIIQFYLGPMRFYIVSGPQNVQAMFRKSTSLSSDKFLLMVMEGVMCFTKEDHAKFTADKTGRLEEPRENTMASHKGPRVWQGFHNNFHDNLSRSNATSALTAAFYRFFQAKVQDYPLGEWTTVHLFDFMRTKMAAAATKAIVGEKMLQQNGEAEVMNAFWEYDRVTMQLVYALPKWIDPRPWRIRDHFHQMGVKHVKENFDTADHDNEPDVDWHPTFGFRFMREYLKWGKNIGLSDETRAGYFIGFMTGLNGNSVPIASWALFELVKDPSLWEAIRAEAEPCFAVDPASGERIVDIPKLLACPLLQSVYIESLRCHVAVNVTREVIAETTTVAGYQLPKHSIVQAPTQFAHYDEKAWGVPGHPASEFYAARNVKYATDQAGEKTNPEFVMKARPNEFFPYGGGVSMCPGRHFAKQEIMASLAIIVTTFDVEFVEWTSLDRKTKSDRPARNNLKYSGSAAMPPDRDLKVRWRRRW